MRQRRSKHICRVPSLFVSRCLSLSPSVCLSVHMFLCHSLCASPYKLTSKCVNLQIYSGQKQSHLIFLGQRLTQVESSYITNSCCSALEQISPFDRFSCPAARLSNKLTYLLYNRNRNLWEVFKESAVVNMKFAGNGQKHRRLIQTFSLRFCISLFCNVL